MEWRNYSDRAEARTVLPPRSLANLKNEISEKKWTEARQWAGGRTSKKKDRIPKSRSRVVLEFLTSTNAGRRVPAEEQDTVTEVSEAELQEWGEEQEACAEEPGAGGNHHCYCPRLTSWRPQVRGSRFHLSLSFVISLVPSTSSWDRPGRRAKGNLQRAAAVRTADRKRTVYNLTVV